MIEKCRAILHVPIMYAIAGGHAQIMCALPMGHEGALHFDDGLSLWWMRLVPGPKLEDVPSGLRMNEDIPAALQREWNRA